MRKMTDTPRSTPIKPSTHSSSRHSSTSSRHSLSLTEQFADVIRRYKDYCSHIQRILKETDKSYNDINDTRVLTPGMKYFSLKKNFFFLNYFRQNDFNANIKN